MRSVLTRLAGVVAGLLLTAPGFAQMPSPRPDSTYYYNPSSLRPLSNVYNPYAVSPLSNVNNQYAVSPQSNVNNQFTVTPQSNVNHQVTVTPQSNVKKQFTVAPVAMQVQTTVLVPNGGEALAGRYGTYSEARNEFGPPGLSKLPYAGRAVRNVGYGRDLSSSAISIRVRVISLAEEEERQMGRQR